jgi:hypothetical protein
MYHYFPEDTTHGVIFRDMILINYLNLNKIIRAIFEKITILYFGAHLKGPYFWSWNVQALVRHASIYIRTDRQHSNNTYSY